MMLERLNPFNSLFGRIFLWFWCVAFVLIASVFFVAKQINKTVQIIPASSQQELKLIKQANRLQEASKRLRKGRSIQKWLTRVTRQQRTPLLLIHEKTQQVYFGMRERHQPDISHFLAMADAKQVFQLSLPSGQYLGPVRVTISGQAYQLYLAWPAGTNIQNLIRRHSEIFVLVIVLLSTGLCAALAWSFVSPIRSMQQVTKQISLGNFNARVEGGAEHRQDELGRLGADLNEMGKKLEVLMSSQKRLLADVSHELRSPLARLQLAIGIVQESRVDTQNVMTDKQLARIELEAQRIDGMIEQVLMLSRLECQQVLTSPSEFNLLELIQQRVDDAQFEGQSQGKQVHFNASESVYINGDAKLMSSAIENILRNALRYAEKEIWVSLRQEDSSKIIVIRDDGCGVSDNHLAQLFTPFYRVSDGRERQSGGVGLGLAIAQQAVAQHSGKIYAETGPEGGLQVTIALSG